MKDMTITSLFSKTYTFQTFKSALTRYIQRLPGSVKKPKVMTYSYHSAPNDPKIASQIVKAIIRCSPSLNFCFGVRISMIGHFYRPKWKNFIFSSLNFKHPIKVLFSIFDLQHVFPEKKSTYKKRQNGSSPFRTKIEHFSAKISWFYRGPELAYPPGLQI